jgi:hypothetical protein
MGIAPSRKALDHDFQESEFIIAATNSSPRAYELKHDDAFAVLDNARRHRCVRQRGRWIVL